MTIKIHNIWKDSHVIAIGIGYQYFELYKQHEFGIMFLCFAIDIEF